MCELAKDPTFATLEAGCEAHMEKWLCWVDSALDKCPGKFIAMTDEPTIADWAVFRMFATNVYNEAQPHCSKIACCLDKHPKSKAYAERLHALVADYMTNRPARPC